MTENSNIKKGVFFALLTAFISGLAIFYNKQIVISGIDPLTFNIIKNGGVAIILSLLLWKKEENLNFPRLIFDKRLILIGIVGGSIPFILYFEGLKQVAASEANLIHKTLFIWVALMAIPSLKEKLNLFQIIGYLLIIYANFFIGGLSGFKLSVFEGMIAGATILWAVENIIAKITLREVESVVVAWGRMFFGTIILILVAVMSVKVHLLFNLKLNQVFPVMGSIVLLTLYVVIWYKALKLAPVTLVTAILVLATPITNILSAVYISHKFPPIMSFNTTYVLLGILLISLGWQWRKKIAE